MHLKHKARSDATQKIRNEWHFLSSQPQRIYANTAAYIEAHERIVREARWMVWHLQARGYRFEPHHDFVDLVQEACIKIWQLSADANFHARNWRLRVMQNHLTSLSRRFMRRKELAPMESLDSAFYSL